MPLDSGHLANPAREAARVAATVWEPPPAIDYNAWAVTNVTFGPESPFPGPYNEDRFPFFRKILHALGPDHEAREIVLAKSAQVGGTLIAQIFVGGSLDLDPGPVLYVHPTDGNGTRWSRMKWKPMVRQVAALSAIFSQVSHKEGGNSILYQERRDGRGYLQISGANSEASLSMVSMPRQVQDDLSKWELNNAGDPETQADSRSKAFEWAKIFKISTPLIADNCRITRAFKGGTQEHYHVPCPHCGYRHALEWENLQASIDEADMSFVHFTCPDCGGVIEERHRADMLLKGEWVANNPGATTLSFHLWAAYSPLESWARIAKAWIAAKGDPAKEQAFLNDTVGRAYEGQGDAPPWEGLRDRANAAGRRQGVIPREALLTTLSFDCQDDRVEGALIGWGRDLKRYVIQSFVIEGHISDLDTHAALDLLLDREFPAEIGPRRRADLAGIDANAWTNEVFDWVRKKPKSRVLMLRGIGDDSAPPLALVRKERGKDGKLKRYFGRFYNVGVSQLKLGLYKFLTVEDPIRRGFVDFPAEMGDEYFQQLTAERRQPQKRRDGFTVYRWAKPSGQANEQLDMMVYGEALAIRLGWRLMTDAQWDAQEARYVAAAPTGQLDLEDLMNSAPAKAAPPSPPPAAKQAMPAGPSITTAAAPKPAAAERRWKGLAGS